MISFQKNSNGVTVSSREMPGGHLEIVCSKCGLPYTVNVGTKQHALFSENNDALKDNLCTSCFKKKMDGERAERIDDIYFGQAMNLSNAAILALYPAEMRAVFDGDKEMQKSFDFKKKFAQYADRYYQLIKELRK